MTAHFLPPIAAQPRPEVEKPVFERIGSSQLRRVPAKRGLPFFGVLPQAVLDPSRFSQRMLDRYGPVHRFRACGNWNVQLVGPEANEFVLFDASGNFSSEGGWRPVFGKHFSGGLLLRDGEDHRWHRKVIAAAFKQVQLDSYLAVFARNIRNLLARWSGQTANLYELAQQLTFANGYEAFLGRDPDRATRSDLLAFRYLMRSSTSVVDVPLPGNCEWRARWARRHVEKLIRPMLEEPPEEHRTDLLALLQRMGQEGLLGESEILAHLIFVIAASFDALSSATTSTLYYLARHPDWQQRAREELCNGIPVPAELSLASLQKCEQSDWCLKEALRLNSAAPVLWRRSVRAFEFAGYSFPAGTITGVNPMLTHLLPSIWDDPLRFDPDRFAPDLVRQRHRYAFVPFGGGAHGCLGANFASLQVRALLRLILERHELRLESAGDPRWYHWPNCRPRRRIAMTLAAHDHSSTSE